jgi:hypothetical protein
MTPRLRFLPFLLLCLTIAGSATVSAPRSLAAAPAIRATAAANDLPSDPQIRAALKDVLSRREFRKRAPSLMERLAEWANRWLDRMGLRFPPMKIGGMKFDVVQLLVAVAAMCGFLFLIWLFVRLRIRGVTPETLRSADLAEQPLSLERLLEQADALAQAGDYRAALERAYVATLLELSRNRWLNFAPHRTNWENLLSLDSAYPDSSARMLRRISRLFDRKWYGLEELGAEEYERAAQELAEARRVAQSVRLDPAKSESAESLSAVGEGAAPGRG